MVKFGRMLGLLTLPGLAVAAALWAQAPGAGQAPQFHFRLNVGDVLLHATVLDKQDHAVNQLPAGDFTVYENDVAQKVAYFAQEDAPVSIGLVIDNSGSMAPKLAQVSTAVLNFVRASNPQDEVFVVNFSDEYYLDAQFTNQLPVLEKALTQINAQGATALYDAIVASLGYLNQEGKRDKKVLLVVTDGEDNASRYNLDQAVRLAQSPNGPLIYCIGLLGGDTNGEKPLKAFAQATGGLAFFPKNLEQVDTITRQVSADIRSQYTIAYHSNQTAPGYRTIRVDVKDAKLKNLSARYRAGYFVEGSAPVSGGGFGVP